MMLAAVNEHCPPPIQAAKAGFELGNTSSRKQREVDLQSTNEDHGQAWNYKPSGLKNTKQSGVNPSVGILHLDSEKDSLRTEMLDGNGNLQNNSRKLASIFEQIYHGESLSVPVDEQRVKPGISVNERLVAPCTEEAMVRPRFSPSIEGIAVATEVRKRKDEGDCAFAKSSRKLKPSKEPISEQQHSKLASETKQFKGKEEKGTLSKNHLRADSVAGSNDTKSLLASGNENHILVHESSKAEVVKDLLDYRTDCTLLPQSVMDVVMLVSEVLPTPGPDDPDLLSIVMNTGVSLPLPFRDCIGRFICNKSTMN